MNSEVVVQVCGETLTLDPERALFWSARKMLLISDVHFGKVGHFRRNGIAVPIKVHLDDLMRIDLLMHKYQPESICFLGDLFHSDLNREWRLFGQWIQTHPNVSYHLIKGNHDLLDAHEYQIYGIQVMDEWMLDPFHLSHEPRETALYNLAGHVHPAVRLRGAGKQGITVPCFHFGSHAGLLPAFGAFTGTYKIRPGKDDRVYAVADHRVIGLVPQKH